MSKRLHEFYLSQQTGNIYHAVILNSEKVRLKRIGYLAHKDDLGSYVERVGLPAIVARSWLETLTDSSYGFVPIVRMVGGTFMRESDWTETEILRGEGV